MFKVCNLLCKFKPATSRLSSLFIASRLPSLFLSSKLRLMLNPHKLVPLMLLNNKSRCRTPSRLHWFANMSRPLMPRISSSISLRPATSSLRKNWPRRMKSTQALSWPTEPNTASSSQPRSKPTMRWSANSRPLTLNSKRRMKVWSPRLKPTSTVFKWESVLMSPRIRAGRIRLPCLTNSTRQRLPHSRVNIRRLSTICRSPRITTSPPRITMSPPRITTSPPRITTSPPRITTPPPIITSPSRILTLRLSRSIRSKRQFWCRLTNSTNKRFLQLRVNISRRFPDTRWRSTIFAWASRMVNLTSPHSRAK